MAGFADGLGQKQKTNRHDKKNLHANPTPHSLSFFAYASKAHKLLLVVEDNHTRDID
jgi:hypothetical protein